jgi:hypothetical protein
MKAELIKKNKELFQDHQAAYYRWARGCLPSYESLFLISERLNVSVDFILGRDKWVKENQKTEYVKYHTDRLKEQIDRTKTTLGDLIKIYPAAGATFSCTRKQPQVKQILKVVDYFDVSIEEFLKCPGWGKRCYPAKKQQFDFFKATELREKFGVPFDLWPNILREIKKETEYIKKNNCLYIKNYYMPMVELIIQNKKSTYKERLNKWHG